jgi:hypothetical protein
VEDIEETTSEWVKYKELQVHNGFFQWGVLIVKPANLLPKWKPAVDGNSFYLKDSTLVCEDKIEASEYRSQMQLFFELTKWMNRRSDNCLVSPGINKFIVNSTKKEEIFFPIVFNQYNSEGIYIYPWVSDYKSEIEFKGFEQYVTGGGLFGSSLYGQDQNDCQFTLLRNNSFFKHQRAEYLNVNKKFPYEDMLFFQFEKICHLIERLGSTDDVKKKLFYHLPFYDYILLGMELYVRGRIRKNVFLDFCEQIFEKKNEHINKLNSVSKKYGIVPVIFSPFEYIFNKTENIEEIFNIFKLPSKEVNLEEISEEVEKEKSGQFVHFCVEKLMANSSNIMYQQIWNAFISAEEAKIDSLEKIFKVANTIVLAMASYGKEPYKTCSILPFSEKETQAGYSKISTNKKNVEYPPTFNITIMDSLISYTSYANNGLFFYFDSPVASTLTTLIKKRNLIAASYRNIGLFSNNQKTKTFEEILVESELYESKGNNPH